MKIRLKLTLPQLLSQVKESNNSEINPENKTTKFELKSSLDLRFSNETSQVGIPYCICMILIDVE